MVTPKPPISLTQPLLLFFLILISFSSATAEDPYSAAIGLPSDDTKPYAADHATACPVTCFRLDPVYCKDGITYWCGCAGAKVAKLRFFQVDNRGSAPLSAQTLLLVHIVWLIVIGLSLLFGFS